MKRALERPPEIRRCPDLRFLWFTRPDDSQELSGSSIKLSQFAEGEGTRGTKAPQEYRPQAFTVSSVALRDPEEIRRTLRSLST